MKREIFCLPCDELSRKLALNTRPKDERGMPLDYPGEHVKRVRGKSIRHMICDFCSQKIVPEQEVVAVSIWTDHTGISYYEWESDYLLLG